MGTRQMSKLSEISIPVGKFGPRQYKIKCPKALINNSNKKGFVRKKEMYLLEFNYNVLPCIKISCTFWSFTQLFTSS